MARIHGVAVDFLKDKKSLTFYDDDGRGVTFIAESDLRQLVEEMRTEGKFLVGEGSFGEGNFRDSDYWQGKQQLSDAARIENLLNRGE